MDDRFGSMTTTYFSYSNGGSPTRKRIVTGFAVAALMVCFVLTSKADGLGESSMIVILPDTQNYAKWKQSGVSGQFDWILNNQASSNIVFVGHVGDIVNDYDENTNQWSFMQGEYGRLASTDLPYAVSTGNHDYDRGTRDSTMMNSYFPLSSFSSMETYGGAYDSSCENTYHMVNINGLDWMFLSLEFGPRDDVLNWANQVVAAHDDNPVMLITHAYLSKAGTRFVAGETHAASNGYGLGADVNDGCDIWDKLVNTNDNIRLVICGHDGDTDIGARKLVSTNSNGHSVCQMLTNYQYFSPAYSGYMLLVEFQPAGDVTLRTYSPTLNQTYDNEESGGELDLSGFAADLDDDQIQATCGDHGTITPIGTLRLSSLSTTNFSIQADRYYHVDSVWVNGADLGPITNYTWPSSEIGGTIHADFSENLATNNTPEWWLAQYGWTNQFNEAALADPDEDGLASWREYTLGTAPDDPDSDKDQIADGLEVDNGLNPLVSNVGVDSDGDGVEDALEVEAGTDPLVGDIAGIPGIGKSALIPILPPTLNYVKWKRSGVTTQFDWILDNQLASNIVFVGHAGDLVHEYDGDTNQWAFIQSEYERLGNASLPYVVSPGDHDYKRSTRDSTMMNQYFPSASFQSMSTFGGAYESSQCDNSYHFVDINGLDWMILSLELGPRDDVLKWAGEVVATHSNTPVMIITHAYLNVNGTRFVPSDDHAASNYGLGDDINEGSDIWDKLVYTNDNIRLVISGQDSDETIGARLLTSTNQCGHDICQILTNYQDFSPTYSGYMLLIEFQPTGNVAFRTYSPISDQTYTNLESRGELDLTGFMPDPNDLDRDEIPDAVEAEWGGDCDPDEVTLGGHYTYLQTYVLDYQPDSTNLFTVDLFPAETLIRLEFPSTNSRLYTAEYNDTLTNSSGWIEFSSQSGSNGVTTLFDSTATQRFYRINVQLP
jgi:hypothetical protein